MVLPSESSRQVIVQDRENNVSPQITKIMSKAESKLEETADS